MSADPWVKVRTRHDLPADEVISALQKELRRGNVENAAMLAYEMFTTSPELEEKLWSRLQVIAVEDIGAGDWQAPILVNTLYIMSQRFDRASFPPDRGLFAIHAVRYLATRAKDRSSDEMYNWIRHSIETENQLPVIPDYAVDMHTARGQAMGRGPQHFYEEGARIAPELAERESKYHQSLLDLLSQNEP